MKSAKLISKYKSRLKVNSVHPMVYNYDLGKYFSIEQATDFIKKRVQLIPNNENFLYATNARILNLQNKTFFSGWRDINDINIQPNYFIDSGDLNLFTRFVSLYIIKKSNKIVKVGNDQHNDCLFNSLAMAFEYNLPKIINKPWKFKKYFDVERDDKIILTNDVFKKLEDILKCSFCVSGNFEYTSDEIKKFNINLNVKDEHIKLKCNKGRDTRLRSKKIIPVKFVNEKIYCLFDDSVLELDNPAYNKIIDDSEILILKCLPEDDLQIKYNDYIQKADNLIIKSKGLINYYKSCHPSDITYDIYKQTTRYINTIDRLDEFEQTIVDWAYHGGIHYTKPSDELIHGKFYDVDMNSCYLYYISNSNFNFPVTKPEYKIFEKNEFNNLKFYPYGYYFVVFDGIHPYFNIKPNINAWCTHHDLNMAKLLKINFSIVEGKTNALLYGSKNLMKGVVFEKYVNTIYDLKKQGEPVKDLTMLHGVFSQKISKIKRVIDDESIDILTKCAAVCLKQYCPEIADDAEDYLDLPTVYKLIDIGAGIKINKQSDDTVKDQAIDSGHSWDELDLAKIESEVFLLGIWKDYGELESSISMPELVAILESKRDNDYEEKKFLAAIQGINLDENNQKEQEDPWTKLKNKVFNDGRKDNDIFGTNHIGYAPRIENHAYVDPNAAFKKKTEQNY